MKFLELFLIIFILCSCTINEPKDFTDQIKEQYGLELMIKYGYY